MTSHAHTLERPAAVPAPARVRPPGLTETRPWDRIAFRPPATTEADDDVGDDAGPALSRPRPRPVDLPDPRAWCGALVHTCVEVLLGARAPGQLARWLTADLYASLSRRAVIGQAQPLGARRVRVLRVHLCRIDDTHHEGAVVLHDGRRVRAAAIRIEEYRGRWRATALEIG